jgi:peptide/nickel transport system ATP-binding protein
MTPPVLVVDRLTVSLPRGADRSHALSEVSFDVAQGQLLCLVGESGSGKSIAAHTVMGLLPGNVRATAGRISFAGEDLLDATSLRMRQLRGKRMSMIFQEPMTALNPVMTCGSQIDELLVQHTALSTKDRRQRVLEMLERVRLPDTDRIYGSYPHQLSGGQRQRIMIAMATILRPALLIADEPTTALDVTTQAEVLRLIRELQRENDTAVLFITHDFGVVAEVADTVAVLKTGAIVEAGPCGEVLKHSRHPYTRMLLEAVPSLQPRKRPMEHNAVVRMCASGLTKVFESGGWFRKASSVSAASDVDFEVRIGETLGIVGESGSGKSTLARLAARLIEPTAGRIDLDGKAVADSRHGEREFRRKVQVVFQDPYRSLNPRLTVGASIMEGPLNFGMSRKQARILAAELMEMVKLSPGALGRYPHEFSGGQRQRICIARALAVKPELLIADEAVSALDVSVQAQILALFEELRQRLNLTLVFITHDLRVAAQICNAVLVMQNGRVVESGPLQEVFQHPKHPYTRALLDAAPGRGFDFGARNDQKIAL